MTDVEQALRLGPPGDWDAAAAEATPRLAARAHAEGMIDVAWTRCDAPVGELLLAATPRGLVTVFYADAGTDAFLDLLARRLSPRILHVAVPLDPARRQLDEYFAGRRQHFDLTLDWSLTGGFGRAVLQRTAAIPYGTVSTYAAVASAAGSPRGARAAGQALGSNPLPIVVPCHRVLRTGGGLGGYTGGLDRKARLLRLEGVPT